MNHESKWAQESLLILKDHSLPNSRALHLTEDEVRQKCQEAYMDDQDTPGQIQTQKENIQRPPS